MLRGKRKAFLNIFRGSKKKEALSPKETEWFLVFNVKNLSEGKHKGKQKRWAKSHEIIK